MENRITAVLIDTSAYHYRQCDFAGITSEMIPMFLQLMDSNRIPVLSHPILDNEVRKHIKDSQIVERARALCKALKKGQSILRSVGSWDERILSEASPEKITDTLTESYEEFKRYFVMLPYVDAKEVFEDYFNVKPPFSTTADKKAEFPDAFILKGLFEYCKENPNAYILVVSNDSDWHNTLRNNSQIKLVSTLQDALLTIWPQLNKSEFVWWLWDFKIPEIMSKVASTAEDEAFSIDGIYELEDIEIYSVRTTGMVGHMTPLEITEESVLLHAEVSLSVDGVAEYLDESRSVWDKEDQEYIFAAYSRLEFHNASAEVECEVRLSLPPEGNLKSTEVENVRLTNKWDISLDVSEADTSEEDITEYGTFD